MPALHTGLRRGMARPTADRVPLPEFRSRTELARSWQGKSGSIVLAGGQLLLEGGLVVVELQVRQVGQINREVKSEIAVGVPHEVEAGPPLVQLPLQPDHLRFELGIGDVVLRRPGEGPERCGGEAGTESQALLAGRTGLSGYRPGARQCVVEVGRKLPAAAMKGNPPAVVERTVPPTRVDHVRGGHVFSPAR